MSIAFQNVFSSAIVVVYMQKTGGCLHETASHQELAKRIARLRSDEFGGNFDPACRYDRPLYFVPNDTLVSEPEARDLGIGGEQDLFGGVVPYPFVATKTITHGLPDSDASAPPGWSEDFAQCVRNVVLPGFTAFSRTDARGAGIRLLERGAVRVKKPSGIGGLGQSVVRDQAQLDDELDALDDEQLAREGIVLECNLVEPETRSVGQVRIGELFATYCGTQHLTVNNQGAEVYGGSDLVVVRGGFDRLLQLPLEDRVHTAIAQARRYHEAAMACFSGMIASRSNYDIAQGADDSGRWHSGVLEQSWRVGGATGAELAALAAFRADPALQVVRASTAEIYGENPALPPDADVYFQGNDERIGPLTKYARLEDYGDL
ncbi:MAG TPA: DUF3182 family protein [Noviherbaspirillum sp.]|uniref:DUF3182 family protein n=1 Tax=Noviherbaspirillum sp. TaxID=1926288 RepID=UPI002D6D1712|nr:DUF3182 family protein [Noviherbaspirillum sp.]HYD95550.1 DUF3182 family protein [Noviherbaspirillum sp.]